MPYFKIVKGDYNTPSDLHNEIYYVLNPRKTPSGKIGGFPMTSLNPADVIEQFNLVKSIHHKESGKQLHHFIVSFPETKVVPPVAAYNIACLIAGHLAEEFQIVFAVHEDTDSTHIHFVVNSVSYKTGLKNCFTLEKLNDFRSEVEFLAYDRKFKNKYYCPF